jgi:multidrug efflux pump subunit AcrA (membrane-fusion protein)
VLRLIPVAQEESRTFRIRIGLPKNASLAGASPSLKPGSFGRGRIITREVSNALVVPKSAIVQRDGHDAVFVVSNHKAALRPVSLGITTQNGVEVTSGLGENDQVVIRGAQALQDGMPVEIGK